MFWKTSFLFYNIGVIITYIGTKWSEILWKKPTKSMFEKPNFRKDCELFKDILFITKNLEHQNIKVVNLRSIIYEGFILELWY